MAQYRKKPVVIEALPVSEVLNMQWQELPEWVRAAYNKNELSFVRGVSVHIETLEGIMEGKAGDWLIQGVVGELYPCKGDIFEATYEAVEADNAAE